MIPIYFATIHEYKREVIVSDQYGQVTLSADVMLQINSKPQMFTLSYLDWNPEKEAFVQSLANNFAEYVVDAERGANSYDYVVSAMRRWYMALPKYVKESKKGPNGEKLIKGRPEMLILLKQNMSGNEFCLKLLKALVLLIFRSTSG